MRQQGFTLIEALVALSILMIVLAVVVPTFVSNAQLNTRTEERAQATSAIETVLDDLRTRPVGSLATSGTQDITSNVGGRAMTVRVTYCRLPAQCSAAARMITAEYFSGTKALLTVETIFTEVDYVSP